jgi:hypothetical protein
MNICHIRPVATSTRTNRHDNSKNLLEFADERHLTLCTTLFLGCDGGATVGSSHFVSPLEQLGSTIIVRNLAFNQTQYSLMGQQAYMLQ